jgi:L-seryl-tRNA(Ser) seleniumtransferase
MPDNQLYRMLPQVGEVLESERVAALVARHSHALVSMAARAVLAQMRAEVKAGEHTEVSLAARIDGLGEAAGAWVGRVLRPSLRPVVNATGVILQTNLGRAPLSEAALRRISEVARGYCNLEMDLDSGERSRRDVHVERLILDVLAYFGGFSTDSLRERAAAVVNNCAGATFLALNTLAEGGEVIVSRGELVEIGGGFRVPEILRKSGAILREVGTTNRTRVSDYAAAITPETRLILRVHRSNFRIEGFTESPSLDELIELGKQRSIPVFEDQGTGCLVDLEELGIADESSWRESVGSGAALVACSGDKLLGGPQCGLLIGSRGVIEAIRRNPLFRALRVDKLTYAALEATLLGYLGGQEGTIPAVAMLSLSPEAVRLRCEQWALALESSEVSVQVVETRSLAGGGTTPGATLPSFAVALRHKGLSEQALAARLRGLDPPIVSRTRQGQVLLDLRTVPESQDTPLLEMLRGAFSGLASDSGPGNAE